MQTFYRAGVPQGSPLSLILFILYNSTLLELLQQLDTPLTPLGFADDINLLTYSTSTALNCERLQDAHEECLAWAARHGLRFAPAKYTLTHFTRRRCFNLDTPVTLRGGTAVQPEPSVKVLGVTLDSRLNWKQQEKSTSAKMKLQMAALYRTTAST